MLIPINLIRRSADSRPPSRFMPRKPRMAGGLIAYLLCFTEAEDHLPFDETLSGTKLCQISGGQTQREHSASGVSLRPRCFSLKFALQHNCSICVSPINLIRRSAKTTDRPRDYATKAEWRVVLCLLCYVSEVGSETHLPF